MVVIHGTSLGKQLDWSCNRTLTDVNRLHWFYLHQHPYDTVVDSGCGAGAVAAELKRLKPSSVVIAVGAHDLQEYHLNGLDYVYYIKIPYSLELLNNHIGTVSMLIDTFGTLCYCDNIGHTLMYLMLLLKKDGLFSTILRYIDLSKLYPFFLKHFGVELTSKLSWYTCTDGKRHGANIIRFTFPGHNYNVNDYDRLIKLYDTEVKDVFSCNIWYSI